ncbi:DUF5995 family protein [Rugosimonospora acidiphila]|uniref:DUF5995 family protein n=1 Tax=Rugosimonospora acidiphila TaxID=556531 RepID=A0ABP9RUV6_9ACTN
MTERAWEMVQGEIAEVASRTPHEVAEVVAQLSDLQILLDKATPDDDENPVAAFNHLYWTITSTILDHLNQGAFRDPEFLTVLDVEFAKRYFNAIRLWGRSAAQTPEAWKVLFRQIDNKGIRSLPAAIAGVNAHVNYDLPFAVVRTWELLGTDYSSEPQHQDYLHVNEIFYEKIPQLRRGYLSTWQLVIDRLNGPLDDWYEDRAVEIARDIAWMDAKRLWAMRGSPERIGRAGTSLDHHTALIGWALLSPLCAMLQ